MNSIFRRRQRGQGTVEFALVLPLLITTIMAIVELSWAMFQTIAINHVCRGAARRGSIGRTCAELDSYIQGSLGNMYRPTTQRIYEVFNASGATAASSDQRGSGWYLRVTIVHRLQFFTPIMDTFNRVEASTTVQASSQFQCE